MVIVPRILEPEILDDAPDATAHASLAQLELINRWFGGERILHAELARLPSVQSVLDVAAGNGWAARSLHRRFGSRTVSLDRLRRNLTAAPNPKVIADARALPFADSSFDVVISSLFLHHLTDSELTVWFADCARIARHAVVCIDLERSWLAGKFLPLTRPFFGWLPVTMLDGATSHRAAFTKAELMLVAARSGLASTRVHRAWPWQRLVLSVVK